VYADYGGRIGLGRYILVSVMTDRDEKGVLGFQKKAGDGDAFKSSEGQT
jgi:hypothetical protein